MQIENAVRTLMVDAMVDSVDAGAAAGTCIIKNNGGTTVATITLSDPAFNGGVNGVAAISGTPSATASGAGDFTAVAGTAEFRDSDNNLKFTLTVGGPTLAGSTEMDVDRDTITAGDTVTITGLNLTQPAS